MISVLLVLFVTLLVFHDIACETPMFEQSPTTVKQPCLIRDALPHAQQGEQRNRTTRIVGGHPADPTISQYMAWIITYTKDSDEPEGCSGIVISRDRILTAAHCFKDHVSGDVENVIEVFVLIGIRQVSDINENWKNKYKAYSIDLPFEYDQDSFQHDIAIITLDNLLPRTQKLALLPPHNQLTTNESVFAAGYGFVNYDKKATSLQQVMLTYRDFGLCKNAESVHYKSDLNQRTMLCASSPNWEKGGKDTCYGDSGGPLFKKLSGVHNRIVLYGLTSFGSNGCAEPNSGAWYVKVQFFVNRIKNHIKADGDMEKISPKEWYNIY